MRVHRRTSYLGNPEDVADQDELIAMLRVHENVRDLFVHFVAVEEECNEGLAVVRSIDGHQSGEGGLTNGVNARLGAGVERGFAT